MARILFVDSDDNPIGAGERKDAYAQGIAHRIVRVFLFNSKGEFLLQKRSANVDAPLKWDQSAAGHVDEGEDYEQAVYRELKEELGVDGVPLTEVARYYVESPAEPHPIKRFNAIYAGVYDGEFAVDPGEVAEVKWVTVEELEVWMVTKPGDFTGGFLYAYDQFKLTQ